MKLTKEQFEKVEAENKHRTANRIPFAEQLIALRKHYGLSAYKMSVILGFGLNIYRHYEKGDLPNKSNSNLLRLIFKYENFVEILDFSKLTYEESAFLKNKNNKFIFNTQVDEYTGYRIYNLDKLANLAIYYIKFKLKFKITDFILLVDLLNYSRTGYSVTGLQYVKENNIIKPIDWNYKFADLENEKYIENKYITKDLGDDEYAIEQILSAIVDFDYKLFNEDEMQSIQDIEHNSINKGLFDCFDIGKIAYKQIDFGF